MDTEEEGTPWNQWILRRRAHTGINGYWGGGDTLESMDTEEEGTPWNQWILKRRGHPGINGY